jgi:hypothetical protein
VAGRDPAEATQNFVDPLQKAISCVCPDVLLTTGYYRRAEPHVLFFGRAARLRGDSRLRLRVTLEFTHVQAPDPRGPWKVTIAGYWYALEAEDEQELIVYHWHPNAAGEITFPHLHLESAAQVGYRGLVGTHVPTGWVELQDVLRFAITHLDVKPRRDDWRQILDQTQATDDEPRGW